VAFLWLSCLSLHCNTTLALVPPQIRKCIVLHVTILAVSQSEPHPVQDRLLRFLRDRVRWTDLNVVFLLECIVLFFFLSVLFHQVGNDRRDPFQVRLQCRQHVLNRKLDKNASHKAKALPIRILLLGVFQSLDNKSMFLCILLQLTGFLDDLLKLLALFIVVLGEL